MVKKTKLLKDLILAPEILVMPGAHDALSARIIESVGFKAVSLGGAGASICTLGKADVSLMTLTEMATHIKNIAEAVDIPVFADGDTGHGNVTNVIRTTREFEKAGAAGFFIEDQEYPKRCGHTEGKRVIPVEEMVPKIKAAVDARVDSDLVIMARTDALGVNGIEDAIERANKYREAGADMIFVEALTSREQMIRIRREIPGPLMASQVEQGKTPIMNTKELEELGFNAVVYPGTSFMVTAYALRDVMSELLKTGTTLHFMDRMMLFDEVNNMAGLADIREKEAYYYQK
jgi:carboxyvinyl-carboxyphosphonate phosphorylmutase